MDYVTNGNLFTSKNNMLFSRRKLLFFGHFSFNRNNTQTAVTNIKLLPDRYLSHQQAYLQLTNWVNESFAVQNIRTI